LRFRSSPGLLLRTSIHPLNGVVDLIHRHFGELTAGRQDRRLVSAKLARSAPVYQECGGRPIAIDILGQGLATGHGLKNLQPPAL